MSIIIKNIRSPGNHLKNLMFKRKIQSTSNLDSQASAARTKKVDENQTTIDSADVNFFSNQMKEWWDPNGPMKPLHSMNLLRVPFVRDGLVQCSPEERTANPLKNQKILDVGCGGGILSEGLARVGASVTGIDASRELIDLANVHKNVDPKLENNKPHYFYTTIEEHAVEYTDHYDGVVASEVIEHVSNKELFVQSCVRALKPGGRIFFTTPNRTQLSNLLTICMAENVLRLTPRGTHQYDKYTTPNELTFMLERNNCHVETIYGVMYHFLWNKWEFIKNKQLMFALQAVKL